MTRIIAFLFSCAVLCSCQAQEKITEHVYKLKDGKSEGATISDFSMLQGDWSGTGLGGQVDELWMPARAEQMHGIFRMEEEGKLVFTEYMSILKDSLSYVLKVKHFSPEFIGWEEKDDAIEFRFIKKENNTLYFSGLTAIRKDDNHLDIYVAFKNEDGTTTEEIFTFTKNDNTNDK